MEPVIGADTGSARNALFGVVHVNCAFTEHQFDRFYVSNVDTAYGILSGGAGNGELTQFDRLFTADTFRAFFCNNPQSFLLNFTDWYVGLDKDGLYLDFAESDLPGVGVNLYNCHATFGGANESDGQGTLVRIRRGTGIVQWTGGRVEHLGTLLNYDSVGANGLNDNLDVVLRGLEFEGLLGARLVSEEYVPQYLVLGLDTESGSATQYGLLVDKCRFKPQSGGSITAAQATLRFLAPAGDRLRCVFDQCRFEGIVGFATEGVAPEFVRCWRSDYEAPGSTEGALRQFSQDSGTPGARTQSVRTVFQDTPWIQTGPRFNALKNADLKGQERSTGPTDYVDFSVSAWDIAGGSTDAVAFGKWGDFAEANIGPSPESFYLRLKPGRTVGNVLDFIDLDVEAEKVVTYQCLCRVTGTVVFRLVNSEDTDVVYDEVSLTGSPTGTTLVTLRMQLAAAGEADSHCKVTWTNPAPGDSSVSVVWQQAWGGPTEGGSDYPLAGGLANAGFVRTPGGAVVQGTYPWAVNALGVKAAGRFQLPLLDTNPSTGDARGMGWQSPMAATTYDLQDGEAYTDDWQKAVMARLAGGWFCLHQPERVATDPSFTSWDPGKEKNVVYSGNGTKTLNLSTSLDDVAPGTVVRVANFQAVQPGNSVTLTFGGSGSMTLATGKMCEFLFYDDGGNGRWLATQFNVDSAKKP